MLYPWKLFRGAIITNICHLDKWSRDDFRCLAPRPLDLHDVRPRL